MRVGILIALVLVTSGCVNDGMNPGEMAACIHATRVQVVDVPSCTTEEDCLAEWKKSTGIPAFHHLPVSGNIQEAQHRILLSWQAMRDAQEKLDHAREACEKGSIAGVIQHGIPAAGDVQDALYSVEKAQWSVLEALNESAQRASTEELTRIKDTRAYEKYARILEILHDLATGNPSSEWGKEWGKNQEYYLTIGESLSNQPVPAASYDWEKLFSWYDTGIGIAYPEKKKTMLWFSTLWKGALTSLSKGKSQGIVVDLLQSIQAEEMMQSVEVSVSPTNGLLIVAVTLIAELEKEWTALENEERKTISDMKVLAQELEEKQRALTENAQSFADAMERMNPYFTAYEVNGGWKPFYIEWGWKMQSLWEEAEIDSIEKTLPLGERIEHIRELEKQMKEWNDALEYQEASNQDMEAKCQALAEKMDLITEGEAAKITCQGVDEIISHISPADGSEQSWKIGLEACVEKVNAILTAMGGEELNAEKFIVDFGHGAAIPACHSMESALAQQYADDPLNKEWMAKREQVMETWSAWLWAQKWHPNDFPKDDQWTKLMEKWGSEGGWLSPQEVEKQLLEMDGILAKMGEAMHAGLQSSIHSLRWKMMEDGQSPETPINGWKAIFFIPNPFGQTVQWPGAAVIPKPVPDFELEDGTPIEGDEIIIEAVDFPPGGIELMGVGNGKWATIHSKLTIDHVTGNIAEVKEVLSIESAVDTDLATWERPLTNGIDVDTLRAEVDGKTIPVHIEGDSIHIEWPIHASNEEINLHYFQKGIVAIDTVQLEDSTEDDTALEWYFLSAKNTLGIEFTTSLQTGIAPPPTETYAIMAIDEEGKGVKHSIGMLGEIILDGISFHPLEKREISILISREKEEGKPHIQETMEEALKGWVDDDDDDMSIAALAEKLLAVVKKNGDSGKWPSIVEEFLQLKTKVEADRGIEELKPLPTEPITVEKDNRIPEEIGIIRALIERVGVLSETYKTGLGISCTKLSEVGYYCPIDETTLREWKTEMDRDVKGLTNMEKEWNGGKTNPIQEASDREEREKMRDRWTLRESTITRATEELEQVADGLREELRPLIEGDGRDNVQEAWDKIEKSLEEKEFGKATFIARNLRDFYSSERKGLEFFQIPPAGYPLIGIILVGGGVWFYRRQKRDKNTPVPLKPLPGKGNRTIPSRAQTDNVESSLPRRPKEYRQERTGRA